jgi:hypothetical protein
LHNSTQPRSVDSTIEDGGNRTICERYCETSQEIHFESFIAQRLKSSSHRVYLSGGQPLHAAAISMAVSSFRHGDWQRRRDTSAGTVTRDLELAAQYSEPDSAS